MPSFQVWLGVILIILGVAGAAYSTTMKTTESDGKKHSSIHWIAVIIGVIVAIIGFLLIFLGVKSGIGVCRPTKGFKCLSIPENEVKSVKYLLATGMEQNKSYSNQRYSALQQMKFDASK
jgi:hypothetical protein